MKLTPLRADMKLTLVSLRVDMKLTPLRADMKLTLESLRADMKWI